VVEAMVNASLACIVVLTITSGLPFVTK